MQLAIVQVQHAQLLRAIDLTDGEVRDQMIEQARHSKKVGTLIARIVDRLETLLSA